MEFMEMQHALVVSLIGFFGSWAIVLVQSCIIDQLKISESSSKPDSVHLGMKPNRSEVVSGDQTTCFVLSPT